MRLPHEEIVEITEEVTAELIGDTVDVQIIGETEVIIITILHHGINHLKITTIIFQTLSPVCITIRHQIRMPNFNIRANKI